VSDDFILILQLLIAEDFCHQKCHKKMALMLNGYSATTVNFRLPEAAIWLIARVLLLICKEGQHIPEVQIFHLFDWSVIFLHVR
jgi:hypothetical protein